MKKISSFLIAFLMVVSISATINPTVKANAQTDQPYTVECSDEENLATNKWNWFFPTLNSAEFSVDETNGMKFDNFIKDQQCVTYYRGGNFSEFKLSLLVNAIVDKFINLSNRGIFIRRMIADAVSKSGEKFCKMFGMSKIVGSNHDSTLYEITMIPPKFRIISKKTRDLCDLYQKVYDEESYLFEE